MNPWLILVAVLACAGSFWYGTGVGADSEIAKQKKLDDVVLAVKEAAQDGAAKSIAANKPINQTIVQKVQHEIETNTVYRDCRNTPDGVLRINEALTGRAQPPGDRKLPGAGAPK